MFPIPWNFPFRKKNGNLVNLGDAIDGGTEIPEHDVGDAGKVLSVDENGDLEWSDAETEIPEYGTSDAGKVLSVDTNGDLEWSNEVPTHIEADAGKLLSVDDSGGIEWSDEVPQAIQDLSDEVDGGWYKGRNLWNDSNVSGTETVTVTLKNPLPAGTYTISAIVVSSDTDADTCLIYDVTNSTTLGQIARSTENDRVAITFTTANAIADIRFYASNSFNGSQGDTFSFTNIQIEKGESATKYVPYAMTNRELTDAIANSYVFKGMESKTVTSDGVKTYKELIEELRDTVNSYVTSLGAEYYIITRSIEIWSIQYNAISPKLAKILYDCRYRGFYFDGANAARIRECFPSTGTNTYLKELVFNTSPTIAINDMSDTTLANGATIVANFEVYKKV